MTGRSRTHRFRVAAAVAATLVALGGVAWAARIRDAAGQSRDAAARTGELDSQARDPASAETAKGAPVVRPSTSVVAVSPTLESWPQTLLATGAVAAWQEAVIAAEYGGLRITELHADVGSRVRRGQLMAVLADDTTRADLQKQQATVAQARATLGQAQANVERGRVVGGSGALSGQTIEGYRATEATSQAALDAAQADLKTTQIHLAQTRILAVDDGIVSSRTALLGNVVTTGSELFRLVRQGRIDWQAELDARQLAQVAIGQPVRVSIPGGKVASGKVRLIAPTISTSTGRAIVYAALDAESGAQPGLYASGSIDGPPTPATTLPQSAVVLRDGRSDVFLILPPPKEAGAGQASASRRTVVTGRRRGDRVEIVSGLPAGAKVVESGGAFLSEGMAVRVVAAATTAAPHGAPR